jgi:phytoene synthase
MQLTNIARDVGEDARRGRIYLPLGRLQSSGVDPEAWLIEPKLELGISDTVAWLLDDADRLYARSWRGISRLPVGSRPAIRAAALLYAEIGNEIRHAGYDSVNRRAWTTRMTKLRILARSGLRSGPPAGAFPGAARATGGADADPERLAVETVVAAAASDGTADSVPN